jgi:hypothetical protein
MNVGRVAADVAAGHALESTPSMNPGVPTSVIDRAFEEDPAVASWEYGCDGDLLTNEARSHEPTLRMGLS